MKKKINAVRRSVMKSLTKNIGKSHAEGKLNKDFKVKRVLISRPNHRLGNIFVINAFGSRD